MADELKQTYAALQAENDRLRDVVKKMYAALSAIIDDHDCGNWSEYKMEDARIALAEARGETQ